MRLIFTIWLRWSLISVLYTFFLLSLQLISLRGDLASLCKYPALHQNSLLDLVSTDDSCLIQSLPWRLQKDKCGGSVGIKNYLLSMAFCCQQVPSFSMIFIIITNMNLWISLFPLMAYNSLLYLIILVVNCPRFGRALFKLAQGRAAILFWGWRGKRFLFSSITKCRLILCLLCPSPGIKHFSKDPRFFLVGNSITDQELDPSCTPCLLEVFSF